MKRWGLNDASKGEILDIPNDLNGGKPKISSIRRPRKGERPPLKGGGL